MEEKIEKLWQEVNQTQRIADIKKEELERIIKSCRHQFGETIYEPIYHKAYEIPGDAPGTMGVDWRGPCYVPAETEEQWKRVCDICGKTEYTKQTAEKITRLPKW